MMSRGFVITNDDGDDPLGGFMRQILGGNGGDDGSPDEREDAHFYPKIDEDAAIMRLMEASVHYKRENPFVVGDLITPREGYAVKGVGTPCIVVEVRNDAPFNFNMDASSATYGDREDIRVLRFLRKPGGKGEMVVSFWTESWNYEFHPKSDRFKSAE
jgi:hypothetical protein